MLTFLYVNCIIISEMPALHQKIAIQFQERMHGIDRKPYDFLMENANTSKKDTK